MIFVYLMIECKLPDVKHQEGQHRRDGREG